MAVLTRIEDIISAATLYQFEARPKATRLDQGWQRRSGTYTVIGRDYGINPFGSLAAPIAPRKLQWQFRVLVNIGPNQQRDLDLAHDAITRACGKRRMHLLVQSSGGKERVVQAQVTDFQDVTTSADNWRHRDFTISWELNSSWRDRLSRGPHRVGDTLGVLMGATPILMGFGNITITSATAFAFNIYADGSDTLPVPSVDDTGLFISINGPFGGDGGFGLYNLEPSALIRDLVGNLQTTYFQVNKKLATSANKVLIDCGAQSIVDENGTDLWDLLNVPDYQPWWQIVTAGFANPFLLQPVGANPVAVGASSQITLAWSGLYH